MDEKKVIIRITEDGKIFAETLGMKGKECLDYIHILEELLEAETIDSEFTHEYFETDATIIQTQKKLMEQGWDSEKTNYK